MAKKGGKTPTKTMKMIPLGGMGEIGKNLTVYEYDNEIVIVDCGMAFPNEDMPGVDLVLPDMTYLYDNRDKIKGVVITHGHEDHIGAVPYFVKAGIEAPIFATRMAAGLIELKLKEHGVMSVATLQTIHAGNVVQLGSFFSVEFIRVNHSIADAVGMAITTPAGTILHMGDFKIDATPITGSVIDLPRIGELGKEGLLALVSDSTNAERKGITMSERCVGARFDEIFANHTKQRIILATFASNVDRVQQAINSAVKNGRKVAISGRSMENVIEVAMALGYMKVPKGTIIDISEINNYKPGKILLLTTGSQGEPMSALNRMAFSDHRSVEINCNDLVVLSASPIPGNEKTISRMIDELMKKGAEVIYRSLDEVHVSGHACQEELKLVLALAKPKYFIPAHGEHRHLCIHAELAKTVGVDPERIFLLHNGDVLELNKDKGAVTGAVQSGVTLVDGYGIGDIGNVVLKERRHLSSDGILVVAVTLNTKKDILVSDVEISSRGFVYMKESDALFMEIKNIVIETLADKKKMKNKDIEGKKQMVRQAVQSFVFEYTKRRPIVVPMILEAQNV